MSTHDRQILAYFAAQVNRKIADDVLFVVYTERRNRLRIISARLANEPNFNVTNPVLPPLTGRKIRNLSTFPVFPPP